MKLLKLLVAASLVLVSCTTIHPPSFGSHSCPDPGHGPCYKCDAV